MTEPKSWSGASASRWWMLGATSWRSRSRRPTYSDRDTLPALDDGKQKWPSLRLAILHGAFAAEHCQAWCHLQSMRHGVVEKQPDQKGFVVLKRRWVVERTFGWLGHWDGLLRERADRPDLATGRLVCVASLIATNALNNPLEIRSSNRL